MSEKFFYILLWSIVAVLGIGIAIMNDSSSWETIRIMVGGAVLLTIFALIGNWIYRKRSGR